MKRKVIALFLAFTMVFVTAACAGGAAPGAGTAPSGGGVVPVVPASQAPATPAPAAGGSTSAEVFKIVTYQPLTGVNANTGMAARDSIDLAVKYINENGGFNGAMAEVTHFDTTTSVEEAVKIAQMIIETMPDANMVLMSASSNEIAATIQFLNAAEIYNFGLGTSAGWMSDQSNIWTFRAATNNDRPLPQGVNMLIDVFDYKTVAIFNATDESSLGNVKVIEQLCADKGLTITTRQECDAEATTFPGQVSQIVATNPDVVFLTGFAINSGTMVQQLRFGGYKGIIFSKDFMWSDMIEIAGSTTDYVFSVFPYITYADIEDCDIPIMREFLDRYVAAYGHLPTVEGAYRGWDTMMTAWEASKIAGSNDAAALREATGKVKMPGLGGTLDFTKGDREGYNEFNAFICIDGKNILFSDWLESGGYDAYLAKTGRDR